MPRFSFSVLYISLREVETCNSPAPIEAAVYAVRWAHEIVGVNSPTEYSLVKHVFEASKRVLCKPVQGVQVAEKFNTPRNLLSIYCCFCCSHAL